MATNKQMAKDVLELKDCNARRDLDEHLATRDDLSDQEKKSIAKMKDPAMALAMVKSTPKGPPSADAKQRKAAAIEARLSPKERELLAKTSGKQMPTETAARQQGAALVMPMNITQEQARARLEQLDEQLAGSR